MIKIVCNMCDRETREDTLSFDSGSGRMAFCERGSRYAERHQAHLCPDCARAAAEGWGDYTGHNPEATQ